MERLYHVSEQGDIRHFDPRPAPVLGGDEVVWAVNHRCLPNFLTPRDCPRIAWHVKADTTAEDRATFFRDPASTHAVAIERGWRERLQGVRLYLYEMNPADFALYLDEAGYYLARKRTYPVDIHIVDNCEAALAERGVELHICDALWPLSKAITETTFYRSQIRMRNATPRI